MSDCAYPEYLGQPLSKLSAALKLKAEFGVFYLGLTILNLMLRNVNLANNCLIDVKF